MEISLKAKNKAIELVDNIFNNSDKTPKKYYSDLLDEHFHYSRYYGKAWIESFSKQIEIEFNKLDFKNEKLKEDLLSSFRFNMTLDDIHIKRISEIIKLKKITPTIFNYDSNLNPVHFLLDYKNYLLSKHLYSCVFHFLRFKNFSEMKNIFKIINAQSLTGQIFFEEGSDIVFSITLNKAPCFVFYNNDVIMGVDSNISSKINSLFYIPHFLFLHNSYDTDYKKLRDKFKENHQKKLSTSLNDFAIENTNNLDFSKFKNIVNSKINYILCFENETQYHNISSENYITMNLMSLEKNQMSGFNINSDIYRVIFDHIINAGSYFDLSLNKREFALSQILSYLSSGYINDFKNKFSNKESVIIDKIIINKLGSIIHSMDKDSYDIINFKKACRKNQILNDNIADNLYLFFIKHNSFYGYFKKDRDSEINYVINFREELCKSYIEELISDSEKENIKSDLIVSNILAINPSLSERKIRNKIKKITK